MKLSTSSDGSGLLWLPPFESVVEVQVNGVPTTSGFTVTDRGIEFSPIPPAGYPIEVTFIQPSTAQKVETEEYSKRVDVASSTDTYIGEAEVGSSESDPVWRIKKLVGNPERDVNIYFASKKFNQVWADRASVSYS